MISLVGLRLGAWCGESRDGDGIIGRFLAFMDLRNRLRIFDVAGAYVISRAMKVNAYTLNGSELGNELVSSDRRFSLVVSRNGDFVRSFLGLLGGVR